MLTATVDVVVGMSITAEAANPPIITLSTECWNRDWPLMSNAITGAWLTLAAVLMIVGLQLFPILRRSIAERLVAWSLRHAPTRSRHRHSARRP